MEYLMNSSLEYKRSREFRVIARTTMEQYRATNKTTREIAQELAVKYVVEGTVQRFQDQIRVNVQLIDAMTEAHLWAQSYDRKIDAESIS